MKNMKIEKRLILSFIIVTILSSIAGVVGLVVSQNTDRNYSEALVVNGFSQGDIGRFNTYFNKGSALVRDVIFLSGQDVQSAQQELVSVNEKLMDAYAAVKENCDTPEELEQIAIIDEYLPKFQESRDRVVELGLQNRNEEALVLFRDEARPLLTICTTAADKLADLNVTAGNEVSAKLSRQSTISSWVILLTIIIAAALAVFMGVVISRTISRPLKEIEAAAKEMAEGRLGVSIGYESKDELGSLCDSMRTMIQRISFYMGEITEATQQLADGDLNVKKRETFLGDFLPVQMAIRELVGSLNDALKQINQSADLVSSGSDQVSSGSQALSQGATEQASSIEELAATINDISEQIKGTARSAVTASERTEEAGAVVTICNEQMQKMIQAMDEISSKSNEISKIIKTIEDIAFQTNILALNAAVEAARAGEAGKGFAVVADEVRNLASKSAEASKSTSILIEGSLHAVEEGTQIVNETAQTLMRVVDDTHSVAAEVGGITEAANEQAASIAQVTVGVDQISSVIQTNSATAEESAAASEELSGQAQMLKSLVGRFKLKADAGV